MLDYYDDRRAWGGVTRRPVGAAGAGPVSRGQGVLIFDEERAAGSPYVERVWRSHSEGVGSFVSVAESRAELVVARRHGRVTVVVRGPETRPTAGSYPADGEWVGIRFRPGAYIVPHPGGKLVDRKVALPGAGRGSFWLDGSAWPVPGFGDAEAFAERLARGGLLVIDPAVRAALHGEPAGSSPRTLQRHFLRAVGVTQATARQIERARHAATLLTSGVPAADAACQAGYFDQPHLTRSVKRFIGRSPAQLADEGRPGHLSFLYKTRPFAGP